MTETFFIYVLQTVTALLFAAFGFVLKSIFTRLDEDGRRINRLEVGAAKNNTENVTLFHRLDAIEKKLDRLLENWRTKPRE
jgi:hypothetical protein